MKANLVIAAIVVAVAIVTVLVATRKIQQEPVAVVAEKRRDPKTAAEEMVRQWVVNNKGQVEFTEWGPHMTSNDMEGLLKEAGSSQLFNEQGAPQPRPNDFDCIIRACFTEKGKANDTELLFLVHGKQVEPCRAMLAAGPGPSMVPGGADWKNQYRADMAKRYPGVAVPRKSIK